MITSLTLFSLYCRRPSAQKEIKANMQLRVLSQVKFDDVGTSQVNLTTKSYVIKRRNTIIITAKICICISVVKNILASHF